MAEQGMVTIRRQVLEVDLQGTEADGHALQRRLPGVCADVVSPAIESAFGALHPGDAYLCLDRVSIDLTVSSLDRLDADLAVAVRRELAEQLRRLPRPVATVAGRATTLDEVRHRTPVEASGDALVAFLLSGTLPWWFRLPQGRTLEEIVQEAWPTAGGHLQPPPVMRDSLLRTLAVPVARRRLVRQFTPPFVHAVLQALSAELAATVTSIETVLGSRAVSGPARWFAREMAEVALASVVAGASGRSEGALVAAALAHLEPAVRADPALHRVIQTAWPESISSVTPPVAAPHSRPPSAPSLASPPADAAERAGVMVDNAGLVLLQPFLVRFLEGLGVASGDELVDPSRALCLLHHLATGDLVAPEHQLGLAKALCGVPAEEPVEADVGITEEETAEATVLLTSAIGHWEALRGTSPESLRVEFLQRPGVLSMTYDGDWLLRVESRTVDILLDQLPWGYGSFRLPWMQRLMMVEWR